MRYLLAWSPFAMLFATACSSSAYADQVVAPMPIGPRIAIDVAPAKIRAPYDVQVIRENGETLPTYANRDRFYVQGTAGERYTIHVTNPTPHRVEAVVTVDGLDSIDGETGDLHKRGYIVPPYGDVHVEGFRTSLQDVATFRFSSVDGSYAGQKGKARNIGVIAVAIFEEQGPPAEQQIVTQIPERYDWNDDVDASASRPRPTTTGAGGADRVVRAEHAKDKQPEPKKAAPARDMDGVSDGPGAPSASRQAPPPPRRVATIEDDRRSYEPSPTPAPTTNRPGLGTEFGETRYSSATYTQFVRATQRPIAIAELRYNDTAGLMALGIPVQPLPDSGEIMLRETADPFPGDRFARPVR